MGRPRNEWFKNETAEAAELVRKCLALDPKTGELRWRVRTSNRIKAGDVAGGVNKQGYVFVRVGGKLHPAHRLCWLLAHDTWPPDEIDHINGNRSDNAIDNLRVADRIGQGRNQGRLSNSTSGFRGAAFDKQSGRWRAHVQLPGRTCGFGRYDNAETAGAVADLMHQHFFGDFYRSPEISPSRSAYVQAFTHLCQKRPDLVDAFVAVTAIQVNVRTYSSAEGAAMCDDADEIIIVPIGATIAITAPPAAARAGHAI